MIWVFVYLLIGTATALFVYLECPWCGSQQDYENIYRRLDLAFGDDPQAVARTYSTILVLCALFWGAIYALRIKDKWF